MARECRKFYDRLADMICEKRKFDNKGVVCAWIRRKVNFTLAKSVVRCIRGSRTMYGVPTVNTDENNVTSGPLISEKLAKIT